MANNHTTSTLPHGGVLHKWTTPAEAKAIVLLTHGYGEYAERYTKSYNTLIPHLISLNYEVHAPDLHGHGHSPGTRGVMHVGRAVNDQLAIRKKLAEDAPDLPIFLMAHSLGGLVTAGSVVLNQDRITGVVLMSPALPLPAPKLLQSFVGMMASWAPHTSVPQPRSPVGNLGRVPGLVEDVEADPMMLKRQIPFVLAATALQVGARVWAGLEGWTVPTLVLHGTADTAINWKGSEILVNGIKSEDKTLQLFEGERHELLNDLKRDEVLEIVLTWLRERVGHS